jgi:hypothetical protein
MGFATAALLALAYACSGESDGGDGGDGGGSGGDAGTAGSAGAAGSSAGTSSGAAGIATGGNAGRGGAATGGAGTAGTGGTDAGEAGMGGDDGTAGDGMGGDPGGGQGGSRAGRAGMGGAGMTGRAGMGGAGMAGRAGMGGAGMGGAGIGGAGMSGAGAGGAGMAGAGAGGAGMGGAGMAGAGGGGGNPPINLYFSEYYEGTATPQQSAVEIFNAGTGPVDLTQCAVRVYQQSMSGFTTTLLLTTLQPNQVYVVCSSQFTAACDRIDSLTLGVVNGDDSIVLVCNGTLIQDIIGRPGTDPGTEWGTGITSTADNVMRRNCDVTIGDRSGIDDFNPVFDWLGAAVTTLDLGSRFCTN